MAFTNEQLERYSRHIILKEVGAKGQKKAPEFQCTDHWSRRTWSTGSHVSGSSRSWNHRNCRCR